MTVVWVVLLVICAAGLVFVAANALESGYSRASLPQILYFLYLMGAVLLMAVGQQGRLAGALFAAVAVVVSIWMWGAPPAGSGERRRAVAQELARFKDMARKEARNPLAWETVGDIYAGLGEAQHALRAYDEAGRLYAAAKVVRKELFDKMKNLRSPATAPGADPQLRACHVCGGVAGRLDFRCSACGCDLFPSRALHLAARFNSIFKGSKLDRITAAGVAFLPFLFLLGPTAYGAVWGIWTFGLATWRLGPRQGIV